MNILGIRFFVYCIISIIVSISTISSIFATDDVFDITEPDQADEESVFQKIDFAKNNITNSTNQHQDKKDLDANENSSLESSGYYDAATIIALNKITANSSTIRLSIGKPAYFNNATIELHKCWKSNNPIAPMSEIFVTVTEHKFDDDPKEIFNGWLIADQQAVSTFEHPVYEIFAQDCSGKNQNTTNHKTSDLSIEKTSTKD